MTGEPLRPPRTHEDGSFLPMVGHAVPVYLRADDLLCRVFNHTQDYPCLGFNPRIPDPATIGGRFDRTCAENSPFMYGADYHPEHGARTALIETLRPLFGDRESQVGHIVDAEELERRSIQQFTIRKTLKLASLLDPDARARFGAPDEVLISGHRSVTQAWGHYFQTQLDDSFSGVMYNSTPSSIGKGRSFVLWETRIKLRNPFKPTGPEMLLWGGQFGSATEDILNEYNVDVEG